MFASTEVARRIDAAECALSMEIARAVSGRRPAARVFVDTFDGGAAVFAGAHSPVNKMIGVGFGELPPTSWLDRVEREFADRDAKLQAEVSTLANPAFHSMLCDRGYVVRGFENVLGRSLAEFDNESAVGLGVSIESVEENEIPTWATMLMDAFERPDTQGVEGDEIPPRDVVEQVIGDMVAVESLIRYVIRVDGVMASGASLRIHNRIAQFTGSATLPNFRRRGYQTAFVRARLAHAAQNGCDVAVVTTAPGSKSQENLQKLDFRLLYSRALLVRDPS